MLKSNKNNLATLPDKSIAGPTKIQNAPSPVKLPIKAQKKLVQKEQKTHRAGTKQDIVITLLKRPNGATVEEMAEAIGWQKHSVLGLIYGVLRKRLGMETVASQEKRGRVYRLA